MTHIGRFSLKTETETNPSVPTFFIALSSPLVSSPNLKEEGGGNDRTRSRSSSSRNGNRNTIITSNSPTDPMTVSEFISTWYARNMPTLHPRFHYKVSSIKEGHFESTTSSSTSTSTNHKEITPMSSNYVLGTDVDTHCVKPHVTETLPMSVYRQDLKKRIEKLVSTAMDVKEKLWFVQISSGELGSSGAISKQTVEDIKQEQQMVVKESKNTTTTGISPLKESILLFKCHHSMGDAVSLMTAIADLLDEAEDIKKMIENEIQKRRNRVKNMDWWKKVLKFIQKLIWFLFGSIQASLRHFYLVVTTPTNPFLDALGFKSSDELVIGRSISWCNVAPVEEVKMVAKKLGGKSTTVNDVFVSCVSAAIARQLQEHQSKQHLSSNDLESLQTRKKCLKKMNVVIPVHLAGGILPPGRGVGNFIGAFVAKVPCQMEKHTFASDRLIQVHSSLDKCKRSPAPFVSFYMAKFISQWVPEKLAVKMFHKSSANAAVAVTNSRSLFQEKVHINGRRVEAMAGFLPLPPNIPVGVVISSYGSVISLSINAEKWAVPDADKFLTWVLDEYKLLCKEASQK